MAAKRGTSGSGKSGGAKAAAAKAKAKSPRKPGKAKSGSAGVTFSEWLANPSVRTLAMLLVGLLSLGMLGGAGYGLWRVDASARSALSDHPMDVIIQWPVAVGPDGPRHVLDEMVRTEIRSQVEQILDHNPDAFSAVPLEEVGLWLEQSGWFDGSPRVQRIDGKTVGVEGVWRRPVAIVRHGIGPQQRDYMIDLNLRLLPKVYAVGERTSPYITGVTMPPPGTPPWGLNFQDQWSDESLAEGLKLILLLQSQPFANQIVAVDVKDFFMTQRLEIITDRGSRVVWGGPVGEFVPGEADTQQKLAHLMRLWSDPAFGKRIDAGLARLEIFDRHVIIDRTVGTR
jgi:hypothetical protein